MNLPTDYIRQIENLFGGDAPCILDSYEKPALRCLRLNDTHVADVAAKADTAAVVAAAAAADTLKACSLLEEDAESVPWEPRGFYYNEAAHPGRHILHEAGFYYIQEASAMAPVALLSPSPGDRVLDLCAAPGGKSTQIGAYLGGRGLLVSNEPHPTRAAILSENIERMGISAVVTSEKPDALVSHFPLFFDKILVDAPCSGEGMFRKNDAAVTEWSPDNVERCRIRQTEILESAHLMLRPGGKLCYSTCTFSREENETVIEAFLVKHPEYRVVSPMLCGGMRSSGSFDFAAGSFAAGCVRLLPGFVQGEGHFVALLEKASGEVSFEREESTGRNKASSSVRKKKSDRSDGYLSLLPSWMPFDEHMPNKDCFFLMGTQLYLLPPGTPSLEGIRVLRPGLHLGTLEKDRFKPALALARAMTTDSSAGFALKLNVDLKQSPTQECVGVLSHDYTFCNVTDLNYVNLSMRDPSDRALLAGYFQGQVLSYEGEKGWYLIMADGRGVGWGKLSGGIIKNHYPKGLRKQLDF